MGKTSLGDVAEAAGVSKGAASHVFNHPERVRQEVRDRVLKTAKELGYQGPNPAARVLRAGQVGSIGVITSNPLSYFFTDPFARVFMQGVSDECDARGIGLSLISTLEKKQSNWTVSSALVDSFIVLCTEENDPVARLAVQRGLRTTTVDYAVAGHTCSVMVDDFHGARLAANHLVTLGHQHIGVVTFSNNKDTGYYCGVAPERLRGYIHACAEAGIDEKSLVIKSSGSDANNIDRAMGELLSENTNITALLCMSDRIALHAIDYAVRHGISVPDDLSVVGFDDIPEANASEPALTTIRQPIRDKGKCAVQALFVDSLQTITLEVSLQIRNSASSIKLNQPSR